MLSRDVNIVFGQTRECIVKCLSYSDQLQLWDQDLITLTQEYEGRMSFATDAWTSPNHYAYMAVTAHFEVRGEPICIVLDVVELPVVRVLQLYIIEPC